MIIRMPIKDIPVKKGRAVMGVRIMRCKAGDKVMAVAKLVSEEEAVKATETPLACEQPGVTVPKYKPVEVEGPEEEGVLPEDEEEEAEEKEEAEDEAAPKRKRGRPRKEVKDRKKDSEEEE
jgi:hypothetical protein